MIYVNYVSIKLLKKKKNALKSIVLIDTTNQLEGNDFVYKNKVKISA